MAESSKCIEIKVVKGNLVTYKADVIVNSVGGGLNLSAGYLSRAILAKAGDGMQNELKTKYPNGVKKGQIAVTKGHNLNCKEVYHVTLSKFTSKKNHDDHTPEQILFLAVQLCLQLANKGGYETLAFPTLGLGFQEFSPDIAAEGFCEAVRDFEHNTKTCSVKQVHVIVYEKDNLADSTASIYENEVSREVETGDNIPIKSMYKKGRPKILIIRPKTSHIPPRGTKDFIKYIFKKTLRTPSYWTQFTSKHAIETYLAESKLSVYKILDVDRETFQAVKKLVEDTWFKEYVGQGVDALGLSHSGIQVKEVKRIENIMLFYTYANYRQQLYRKVISGGNVLEPVHKIGGGGEPKVMTEKCLEDTSILHRDLYHEVNECYLFHGTEPEVAAAIGQSGLDSRLSSEDCMHGKGVYFAESSTKADQYADRPMTRSRRGKTMILARVCLGESCVSVPWTKYKRAPCKNCLKDSCISHKKFYDSVVTKDGEKLFREFVVYHPQQAYPEYIVCYDRV